MRRKVLARRKAIRRKALRRSGISREAHAELKRLHRWVVMLRYGKAHVVYENKLEMWWGLCPRCSRQNWLQCCHIKPVGKYPEMRYDPDNAFPGCALCHIYWWHKDIASAAAWIRERIGPMLDTLNLRALSKEKVDFALQRIALRQDLAERGVLEEFDRTAAGITHS